MDKQYRWILAEISLPPLIEHSLPLIGVQEKYGPGSNQTIIEWANTVGSRALGIPYTDDSTAWCGLYIAYIARSAGFTLPKIAIRAKSWINFGTAAVRPGFGDVLVFDRAGGGHVAIYVGEDAAAYHVLGGNQKDSVSITRIDRKRMVAARRPLYEKTSKSWGKIISLAPDGVLSHNEA